MDASVCRASAIVFASRQVSLTTMEKDWSMSRATAARVIVSVSCTSKSSAERRVSSDPEMMRRDTALRRVRTTSTGCSSPKAHARVVPVSSPAAPDRRISCVPRVLPSRESKTARRADRPIRRIALGVSSSPSLPLTR